MFDKVRLAENISSQHKIDHLNISNDLPNGESVILKELISSSTSKENYVENFIQFNKINFFSLLNSKENSDALINFIFSSISIFNDPQVLIISMGVLENCIQNSSTFCSYISVYQDSLIQLIHDTLSNLPEIPLMLSYATVKLLCEILSKSIINHSKINLDIIQPLLMLINLSSDHEIICARAFLFLLKYFPEPIIISTFLPILKAFDHNGIMDETVSYLASICTFLFKLSPNDIILFLQESILLDYFIDSFKIDRLNSSTQKFIIHSYEKLPPDLQKYIFEEINIESLIPLIDDDEYASNIFYLFSLFFKFRFEGITQIWSNPELIGKILYDFDNRSIKAKKAILTFFWASIQSCDEVRSIIFQSNFIPMLGTFALQQDYSILSEYICSLTQLSEFCYRTNQLNIFIDKITSIELHECIEEWLEDHSEETENCSQISAFFNHLSILIGKFRS